MDKTQNETLVPAAEWMRTLLPLLQAGHELKLYPAGTSMRPFVRGGRDTVEVRPAAGRPLRRGDIVLYEREDGMLVLHRVHHTGPGGVFCVGDAQTDIEGPIAPGRVHAVTAAITRKGRRIDCGGRLYRLLAGLWLCARPLRPLIFRLWDGRRR